MTQALPEAISLRGEPLDGAGAERETAILYLDADTGKGGASRSLLYIVEKLAATGWQPVVVLLETNAQVEGFRGADIVTRIVRHIPKFRPADRHNLFSALRYLWHLRRLTGLIPVLRRLIAEHDIRLIHVNHENIALTGLLIARWFGLPCVCHIRTQLTETLSARLVNRLIARYATAIVPISEPVTEHFVALANRPTAIAKMTRIYNPAPDLPDVIPPLPALMTPADGFRVLILSNISHNRGVDRVVDVALALERMDRRDIVFHVCGGLAHTRLMPGMQNTYLDDILTRVREHGLDDRIKFHGYVSEPLRALASCDALLRLTRLRPSPWGRDIIEAMMVGLPVVTVGAFQGYVEDGRNGFVDPDFDAEQSAAHLIRLRDDPALRLAMREANRTKARAMFDATTRAGDVAALYRSLIGGSSNP
ncbi:MAG: glycosyltransferase family 4 protein [Proteobacteria bacterium]|nr:glycosyltransferase family 4 protein [Pseudomonadota bacterium]